MREATEWELRNLKGIIYLIQNQYDKKGYVGRTLNTFKIRYSGGKWWRQNHNILLNRVVESYSHKQFKIFVLEDSIEDKFRLKEREVFWADKLQTYAPFGYNLKECGGDYDMSYQCKNKIKEIVSPKFNRFFSFKNIKTGEIVESDNLSEIGRKLGYSSSSFSRMVNGKSRRCGDWILSDSSITSLEIGKEFSIRKISTWEIITTKNKTKFCKENGICQASLDKLFRKELITSKDFCLVETPKDLVENYLSYGSVISPSGTLYKVFSPQRFCKEHSLSVPQLKKLLDKKKEIYKGWTRPDSDISKRKYCGQPKNYTLISPNNEIIYIYNLCKFCRELGFPNKRMHEVLKGKKKSYRGWRAIKNSN